MKKSYNGYPSYNAWNVSLWLNNDEHFYALAKNLLGSSRTKEIAALSFLIYVNDSHTPDGVRWTLTNVRRAMRDM